MTLFSLIFMFLTLFYSFIFYSSFQKYSCLFNDVDLFYTFHVYFFIHKTMNFLAWLPNWFRIEWHSSSFDKYTLSNNQLLSRDYLSQAAALQQLDFSANIDCIFLKIFFKSKNGKRYKLGLKTYFPFIIHSKISYLKCINRTTDSTPPPSVDFPRTVEYLKQKPGQKCKN